ncbi:MAG: POTRA domain-containing protein [Bacteroidia bacterium]|jgi:outer membrane protein assembly factor BamA
MRLQAFSGILFSILLIFALAPVYAQTGAGNAGNAYYLEVLSNDNPAFLKELNYKKTLNSVGEREKELMKVLLSAYDYAYLTASYDSLATDTSRLKAFITFGPQYKWAYLKNSNIDEGVLSELGYREKLYNNQPLHYKKVRRLQEKLITYYENNGYPFAVVKLDSITILEGSVSAKLSLTKQSEERIDSIVIKGTSKIAPVYIYNYLGIKPGSLYNESQLKKVNTRISELPFIRASKPATVLFTNKLNKLILYLEKKQASQFDGIVGVLPDNKTGKILFTGDIRLKLQNGLGKGELIDLNWRRLQTQTQDMKLRLIYPFILRTPFGLDYNFKLYKRDTTFLDVNQNIGLQYMLSGGNYLKLFYSNKTSNLLSTKGLEYLTTLPPNADIQINTYGIGWRYEKLDYRLNPRKGITVIGNTGIGTKTIKKNAKLNPVVYEKLTLNSTQYTADMESNLFIPVRERSTLKLGLQAAFLYNETIFQNELYRIGGLRTLRGFDEESIFASSFSIVTLEYRYILEQNSYLYVFGDGAYYENNNVQTFVHDTPLGFGAGISFETKAGIFSINYALGKQFDNPIQLKSGKLHFGIVNYF